MDTVYEAFIQSAARAPHADFLFIESVTAQTYGMAAGPISWGQARDEVNALRQRYAQAGYGEGHRVGLLLENRPAFLLHWLALNSLGVSVVPMHADMRSAELLYLITHSEIALAVVLPERLNALRAAASEAGRALPVVDWCDAAALPPPAMAAPTGVARVQAEQRECALLYTSGTTGRPKGCQLSNAYFLRAGQWYAGLQGLCQTEPDRERVITPLPLNHVNAMAFSAMLVIRSGGCLVQLDRFHPSTWWQSVKESRATVLHYLGVMPAMLLAAAARDDDRDHQVRFGFGAGVDPRHHEVFEQRFGFPLVEAWAMTETGAAACVIANLPPRHLGQSCFGRPQSFMAWRLVDDQGSDVPSGTPGELLVRSSGADPRSHFFTAYLKDPEATEEAWAGGWFHTGDLVRCGPDGCLYFVDRKKNVIRRSGENISAVEVESVLNQHPAVKAAAVTATADELRGDEVLACVLTNDLVPEDQRAALARSLLEHALQRLAYYKAPGYVAFVEALPLTASQKIQRAELRQLAQGLPGQPQCVDLRHLKKRQVEA
jgi:acyl-CoA synthetase (AMP-forming)/AMP-acid ligase II